MNFQFCLKEMIQDEGSLSIEIVNKAQFKIYITMSHGKIDTILWLINVIIILN